MQIVFEHDGGRREVYLRVHNPDATVADLVAALDPGAGLDSALVVGDWCAQPDLGLDECGLREAMVVRIADPASNAGNLASRDNGAAAGSPRGAAELVVVGGLDAGARFALPSGPAIVGRADTAAVRLHDPAVSGEHALITVDLDGSAVVDDLGSRNGTLLDGSPVSAPTHVAAGAILCLGTTQVEIRDVRRDDRPAAPDAHRAGSVAGTVPFNRPPRPAPPAAIDPIVVPAPPRPAGGTTPVGVVSVLAPMAFSGLMVALTGSFTYALFALLSPVMLVANAIEARRRGRHGERRDRARFDEELSRFRTDVAMLLASERQRRRQETPDVAETMRRAALPSSRLWERRSDHADYLRLGVGIGDIRWTPPLDCSGWHRDAAVPDQLASILAEAATLHDSPITAELAAGGVIGLVGDREAALAMARSLLCQAVTQSGPADIIVVVVTAPDHVSEWDWTKWLPHTRDAGGTRLLSADRARSAALAEAFLSAAKEEYRGQGREARPVTLMVVDDETLTEGRKAPVRAVLRGLGGPVAGIVVASVADRLPAMCTTIVTLDGPLGDAVVERPQASERIGPFLATGLSEPTARRCAQSLARFEDPELDTVGAGLPDRLRLLPLLDLPSVDPAAIAARWALAGSNPRPAAPIGVTEDGLFEVDLCRDGPHALVAGTTGAGKSELLRTLVTGLAASVGPEHLTFMLVDFKGGSAFAECARLPHTVGMVTDLDESLAERALRCLDAEVRHREEVLNRAGASDLGGYLGAGATLGALPRLVVVIDEFATLKAELPDFIDALVNVAQRGRSLGIHLVLATQRPSGAVSENIRANTNLRIALRVQDGHDSTDVIGLSDAARIPRSAAGRAYVRLGAGEVVTIQTALSTAVGGNKATAAVEVLPFTFGSSISLVDEAPGVGVEDTPVTDLAMLVDCIRAAFISSGAAPPRRPWPDPLPHDIGLDSLTAGAHGGPVRALDGSPGGDVVPIAVADDPEAQSQYPVGWRADAHLLLYGMTGSGTSTALRTIAFSLAGRLSPDLLHIYALDFGVGDLAPLAHLPHAGAVITATDRERQLRLVRFLRSELDRRRDSRDEGPRILVLIDGFGSFKAEFDDLAGQALWNDFQRVWTDGPDVGIVMAATAERPGAVPTNFTSAVPDRLVFRLVDRSELSQFGIRGRAVPAQPPGRAIVAGTAQLIQLARDVDRRSDEVHPVVIRWPAASAAPEPIRRLPVEVAQWELGPSKLAGRPWLVPVGIGNSALAPVSLTVYAGEHVLVAGPARSGRSTTLRAIAYALREADGGSQGVLVAGPRSPLRTDPVFDHVLAPGDLSELTALVARPLGLLFVMVDDAEAVDDTGGVLSELLGGDHDGLLVIAAGRNDVLRSQFSHWTRVVRRSKLGVLLRPDVDFDGELLGATLPRWSQAAMTVGRGYVVNAGDAELAQLANREAPPPPQRRRR